MKGKQEGNMVSCFSDASKSEPRGHHGSQWWRHTVLLIRYKEDVAKARVKQVMTVIGWSDYMA